MTACQEPCPTSLDYCAAHGCERQPNLFANLYGEPRARHGDPETSHAAAESVAEPTIRETQRRQLGLLADYGDTHDGLWSRYLAECSVLDVPPCSPSGFRTRVAELVEHGLAADSTMRRTLPSGRQAIVWSITNAGRELLARRLVS